MTLDDIATEREKLKLVSDEDKLIEAARQDASAFGDLYKIYVEQVYRYLYSRLNNVHDAEDATAQTFLAAYQSFGGFRKNDRFAPWLFTIARNKAMDHFRRKKNEGSMREMEQVQVAYDPLSAAVESENLATLSELIRDLPENECELLRLRYLAEMSFSEIAVLLHRNTAAVKKSTYRLLARLHDQLEVSNE